MVEFSRTELQRVANNIAQQLDARDGQDDEKIKGSIWNQTVAPYGGDQVNEDAEFSVNQIVKKLESMGEDMFAKIAESFGIEAKEELKLDEKGDIADGIDSIIDEYREDNRDETGKVTLDYAIADTFINADGNRVDNLFDKVHSEHVIGDNQWLTAYTDDFGQLGVFKVSKKMEDGSTEVKAYNALHEFLYYEEDGKKFDRFGQALEE